MKRAEQSGSRVNGQESYRSIYGAGVMKNNIRKRNRMLVSLAMGAILLAVMGFHGRSVVQATDQGEMHVDVTITDQGYSVKGHTLTDQMTAITFRNNGTMPMGSLLQPSQRGS